MTLKITSDNIETSTLNTLGGGVKISTITYPGNDTAANTGGGDNGTQVFTGYIDDLRITYYPRYTTTFTPPSAAFLLR